MSKQVVVAGNQVRVSVRRSRNAQKTVKVVVKSRDMIIVSLPEGFDIDVDAFLEKHKNLLEKKYVQFLEKKTIFKDGSILYKGNYRKLIFEVVENRPKKEVVLGKDAITIFHESRSDPYGILKRWMTQRTEQLVDEARQKYGTFGDPLVIRVADTTRWGYTRRNGVIVVNWQLVALPAELSEYVIVHELAHLSALNHKRAFQHKLLQIFPDYRSRDRSLHNYVPVRPHSEYRLPRSI